MLDTLKIGILLTFFSTHRNEECKMFSKFQFNNIHAMPLLPNIYPFTIDKKQCDKSNMLIVGGQNASYGEFPHMVALGYRQKNNTVWFCGGSLISRKYVLTAAHCCKTKWGRAEVVRLGALNIDSAPYLDIEVEEDITHPDYKPPVLYNDIALIKLKVNVYFNNYMQPACLSLIKNLTTLLDSAIVATGWGHTSYAGDSSSNLLKVSLKIVTNDECKKHFHSKKLLPMGIGESFFCAIGYHDPTHDTCQGDSGGPLQTSVKEDKCVKQIIGITSIGIYCSSGSPAMYVKVAHYIPWIESVIQDGET